MTGWIFLIVAVVMEVAGTIAAKQADGFKNLSASALMVFSYGLSLSGLTFALKSIEVSIAYPIWTGAASLVVSVIGIILFRESIDLSKGFSIFLLVVGLVGLTMGD